MKKNENLSRFNNYLGEIDLVYHELSLLYGLSDSVTMVLHILYENDGECGLQRIVECSGMSKQTINSALRVLERDGHIYLEAINHKRKKAYLSEKGKELCLRTVANTTQAEAQIFEEWTDKEIETYLALTERYLNQLKKKAEEIKRKGEI